MEPCHSTTHEDIAMLLRWVMDDRGAPFLRRLQSPIPTSRGMTFLAPSDILQAASWTG